MEAEKFKPTLVTASIGITESEVVAEVDGRAVYSRRFSVGMQTFGEAVIEHFSLSLLYTSDAADDDFITVDVGSAFPEDDRLSPLFTLR